MEELNAKLLNIHRAAGEVVKNPPSPIDAFRILTSENSRLSQAVETMREALDKARIVFNQYAEIHRKKETSEGNKKAEVNQQMANEMLEALSLAPTSEWVMEKMTCPACKGRGGFDSAEDSHECAWCNGSGETSFASIQGEVSSLLKRSWEQEMSRQEELSSLRAKLSSHQKAIEMARKNLQSCERIFRHEGAANAVAGALSKISTILGGQKE